MTLSAALADRLLQRQEAIPPPMRRKTALHVADALAIGIAARETAPIAADLRAALAQETAASAATRAFLRSALVHILDFDDIHDVARVHPGSVTLPAALAVADARTPGRRIVEAVCMGNELLCRLGALWRPVGGGPGSDWFLTQLLGYFAAAWTAGIVMGLTPAQLQSALGLAYMQAAGGKEAGFGTGGNARAIYPAFAAQGGVQAALLARAGVNGPPGALDGEAGFFKLYFGRALDEVQRTRLLDDDGWCWADTRIKPWPSCRHSHPYVAAAQQLRTELDPAAIEDVRVSVNRSSGRLCVPLDQRRRPATLQDAKYSIPYMVAFALVHEEVSLATLDDAALRDAPVLAMAARVHTVDEMPDEPGLPVARLQVRLRDGTLRRCELALERDLDEAAVHAKFTGCLAHAGLPAQSAQRAWNAAMALEAGEAQPLLEAFGLGG